MKLSEIFLCVFLETQKVHKMQNNVLCSLLLAKLGLYHKNFHTKGILTVVPDTTSFIMLLVIDSIIFSAADKNPRPLEYIM